MIPQNPVESPDTVSPGLADCKEETRSALLARGQVHTFSPGDVLFTEGEPAGVTLLLLEGSVQLDKTTVRGRRQVLCDATPTQCGGVCMMFMNDPALASLHALSEGTAVTLSAGDFQDLAAADPDLSRAAWSATAACLRHMSELVEQLSFRKVSERIAFALLEHTKMDGDIVYWTQAQLAAEVGTTREVVARCLAGFQASNAVRLGRGRVTVLSRETLMSEVE